MNVILLKQKAGKLAKIAIYIAQHDNQLSEDQREAFQLNLLCMRNLDGHEAIIECILPNLELLEEYLTYAMDSDFKTSVRDFCQMLRGFDGKDHEECCKFTELLGTAGLFTELKAYIDRVEARIDKENAEKAEEERKRKEEEERKRREAEERKRAEERRRAEEERKRKAAEEEKKRKAAEAEAKKRRELQERSRNQMLMNDEFVKMNLISMIPGILAVLLTYVMFLSPVSIIAKWTVLSFWGSVLYAIGGLAVIVIVSCLVCIWVEEMMKEAFSGTYSFVWLPATNVIAIPLVFWGIYAVIRMIPVLDGTWSWIFTILFGFAALLGYILILLNQEDDHIQYTSNGKRQGFKTWSVSTLLLGAVIGCLMVVAFNFDYGHKTIKYHNGDYKKLLDMAARYEVEQDYPNAIDCYEAALERKTSEKKRNHIQSTIAQLEVMQAEYASELKEEIKTLLNTFNKVSFRYGKPENDLKKTQEKINELKKMVPSDDKDVAAFQKRLDYHNNRKR